MYSCGLFTIQNSYGTNFKQTMNKSTGKYKWFNDNTGKIYISYSKIDLEEELEFNNPGAIYVAEILD